MRRKSCLVRTVVAMPSGDRMVCWLPRKKTSFVRTVLAGGWRFVVAVLFLSTAGHS